ncbi:hypothetical protein EIJ19_09150, partial [Xanthomonas perforans]
MKLLATAIGGACLALAGHAAAIDFATGDSRPRAQPGGLGPCKLPSGRRAARDSLLERGLGSRRRAPPAIPAGRRGRAVALGR